MNRHSRCVSALLGAAGCLLALASLGAATDSLQISGDADVQPHQWNIAALKTQFAAQLTPVKYQSHGASHTASCVPVLAVLQAAGVPTELKMDPTADPRTKHLPLRLAIVVQANDGYEVTFSLAELLPDIGHRAVWLALDQDGNPLGDRDGPVRLIVPDDAKPARWIHGVDRITVIDLSAHPTTAPSPPPSN